MNPAAWRAVRYGKERIFWTSEATEAWMSLVVRNDRLRVRAAGGMDRHVDVMFVVDSHAAVARATTMICRTPRR